VTSRIGGTPDALTPLVEGRQRGRGGQGDDQSAVDERRVVVLAGREDVEAGVP
jgi:hypothetical protein